MLFFICKSDQRHQTIVWNIKVFVCIKDLKKANQISEIHIYIFKLLLCIYEKFFQTWKIQKMHFLRWFRLFFLLYTPVTVFTFKQTFEQEKAFYIGSMRFYIFDDIMRPLNILLGYKCRARLTANCTILFSDR